MQKPNPHPNSSLPDSTAPTSDKPSPVFDRQSAILLSFAGGFLGLHLWYLKKPFWQIALHIISAGLGIMGIVSLAQNEWEFGYMWIAAAAGVTNLLFAWFSCMFFALAPAWRWLKYSQPLLNIQEHEINQEIHGVQANGVFIAILCLMLSMGGLMAFLALLFQRYYENILGV